MRKATKKEKEILKQLKVQMGKEPSQKNNQCLTNVN